MPNQVQVRKWSRNDTIMRQDIKIDYFLFIYIDVALASHGHIIQVHLVKWDPSKNENNPTIS